MDTKSELLDAIDKWLRRAPIGEVTFSRRVMNDGKFIDRIRSGGRLTTDSYDRIMEYLKTNEPEKERASLGSDNGEAA